MMEPLESVPFLGGEPVERYRWPNGLTLLFLRDPAAPVFTYQTWFRVGAADDPEGRTGLAHLFEHLMFKATRNRPEGEFMRLLEAAGAPDVNAWTWTDETVYLQSLPRAYLDLIASLEADRMVNLALTPATFTTEREVVLNERKLRVENDPCGELNERLWAAAFTRHPYRRPVIGWDEDIRRLTLPDVVAFYETFYRPPNATLVIVGDLTREEVLATLTRHYGEVPAATIRRAPRPPEPEQREYRTEEVPLEADTELLMLGVKAPPGGAEDFLPLLLLDRVLCGGRSSRLYRKLVDAGLATRVSAFVPCFRDPALYDVTVVMRPGKRAREAERILLDELAALATHGVDEEEFLTARRKLAVSFYSEFKEARGKADFLGLFELATGSFRRGLALLAALPEVTPAALRRAARRWLRREATTSLVGRPKKRATVAPGAPPGPARHRDAPPPTPPLFLVRAPAPPLVRAAFVFQVGSRLDPPGKEGLAYLTAGMLLRGTRRRPKEVLERDLDRLGAQWGSHTGLERLEVGGETLAETWEPFLELLGEVLLEPAFPEKELQKLKDETRARLVELRLNDRALGTVHHERRLFRDHPYGRLATGTEASLAAVTRADLAAFHARWLGAATAVAGLAGALPEDDGARARLEELLARLGRREPVHYEPLPPPRVEGRPVLLVDKPDRTQTYVRIGHGGATLDHPDWPALDLANAVFGGSHFNAILFQEIREKRGWSYHAGSGFKVARDRHTFSMSFSPSVADTPAAITLALELWQRFVVEGVPADRLEFARKHLLGSAAFDETTADKRLRLQVDGRLYGYDRGQHLRRLAALTKEEVDAAVRRHFDPANLLITVVATARDLEGKLARLPGLGPVEVVPYDRLG